MVAGWRVNCARLTCCLVELSEGLLANIVGPEDQHAELTSSKMGPDIFDVDCSRVSNQNAYNMSLNVCLWQLVLCFGEFEKRGGGAPWESGTHTWPRT